jgi:predicted enzyme related to lactoylglutathione lyase
MSYISWFAINADDVPRARDFYQKVFGWTFEPWGLPTSTESRPAKRTLAWVGYRSAANSSPAVG